MGRTGVPARIRRNPEIRSGSARIRRSSPGTPDPGQNASRGILRLFRPPLEKADILPASGQIASSGRKWTKCLLRIPRHPSPSSGGVGSCAILGIFCLLRDPLPPLPSTRSFASYAILRARRDLLPPWDKVPSLGSFALLRTRCPPWEEMPPPPGFGHPGQKGYTRANRDVLLICPIHTGIAHMLLDTMRSP